MKKLSLVLILLASLVCLAIAKEVPVTMPVGNSPPVLTDEYSLAKAAYERWSAGNAVSADEKALIERYFLPAEEASGSLDATGGPDPAYYYYVDNVAPDTEPYEWEELCNDPTASVATTWGDDVAFLANFGLTFPYYGNYYTSAYISSNGVISFGVSNTAYYNSCISSINTNYAIYAYWDDMLTVQGTPGTCTNGVIYYKNMGSYFLIEWYKLDPYSGSGLTSLQCRLYPNGDIKLVWHNTDYTHSSISATVAIEAPGTNGLQYICNQDGIVAGRAVRFYRQPPQQPDLAVSNLQPCGIIAPNPAQVVSFRITNGGGGASPATVAYYSFDNGVTTDSYPVPAIMPSSFFDVFFTVPVNLTPGAHTLSGWVGSVDPVPANDSTSCTITAQRPCPSCAPEDANLDPVPGIPWAGVISGNCGNAGKWTGSFTAVAGRVYHFDLCPDAPGNGSASFDIDIKICDAACTILAGQDGSCVAQSWRPNDFTWTAPSSGTFYVVLAPYPSYASHNCTGTAAQTFTMYYHYDAPCEVVCEPGDIPEVAEDPADPNFYLNDPDGGCNSDPDAFGFIECGQTVCGVGFTYVPPQGGNYRDTDWYLFTIAQDETVTVRVAAEFPVLYGIVSGVPGCTAPSFVVSGSNSSLCTWGQVTANCLTAGTYAMFVAPNTFTGVPTPLRYRAQFICGGVCLPCPYESRDIEPGNNTCGENPPLACGDILCGTVSAAGDNDWYTFTLASRDTVIFDVFANATPGWWPYGRGLDSYIELWTADCATMIAFDDDGGEGFDSKLVMACLDPGTYYVKVRGYAGSSVGPYILRVTCIPCVPPCLPDAEVVLVPNSGIPGPQDVRACAHLVAGFNTMVVVPVFNESNVPQVTITPGCYECGDPLCAPLSAWILGPWTFIPNPPMYVATLTADPEATGCCVCITLDFVLPVELNSFTATAGDNSVILNWITASETNADHFEIVRDGSLAANVTAENNASGARYTWVDDRAVNGTTYSYTLYAVGVSGVRQELRTVSATPRLGAGRVSEYALGQNYPNPFNPVTSISFDLVEAGFVTLKVYNLMGQEVASVVNGNVAAGRHIVTFDATNLSSGVYLYRLEVNGFVAEKKMLLMK